MKTTLLIACAFLLFSFTACKKSDPGSEAQPVITTNILGIWQWTKSMSGWGGDIFPDADSVVKIKMYADSSYIVVLNNTIKYSGSFNTFRSPYPDSALVINFDKNITVHTLHLRKQQSIIGLVQNNSLNLYDYRLADGSSHLFKASSN